MYTILLLCLISLIAPSITELDCNDGCREYDSNLSTVIVKDTNGRLGNAIFSYQILLVLQLGYGYEAFMGARMNRILSPIFENLRIPVGNTHLCNFKSLEEWLMNNIYEIKLKKIEELIVKHTGQKPKRGPNGKVIINAEDMKNYNIDVDALVHSDDFKTKDEIKFPPNAFPWSIWDDKELSHFNQTEHKTGKAYILYPEGLKISESDHKIMSSVPNIEKELENDLTLRKKFVDSAAKTIQKTLKEFISSKRKRNAYDVKDIVFVGIHSRRTDHLGLERVSGYKEVKPSYFLQAMDLFREKFGDKVIYLYVSDDLQWGIQNLGPRVKKSKNLFFVGEGNGSKDDSIGHDLAVMQSCNHTIITHGTFSYWSGFLSNGIVVIPDHFEELRNENSIRHDISGDPIEHPLPRLYHYV